MVKHHSKTSDIHFNPLDRSENLKKQDTNIKIVDADNKILHGGLKSYEKKPGYMVLICLCFSNLKT